MNEPKQIFDSTYLQSLTAQILQEALTQGASQAEVSIIANKGFSVTAHKGEVETIEYNQDKIIEIIVYVGQRTGSASLSDVRPLAVQSAVKAALHIARFTDLDPCAGLATKEELAFNYPQLNLAYPWALSVDDAIRLACDCEQAALSADKRIISAEHVSVGTGEIWHAYANTENFFGFYPCTLHQMSCVLVAKENDEMQRDYSYTASSDPAYLQPCHQIAQEAVKRTVGRLGARPLATLKAPVIFIAEEARGLIGIFSSAIQGKNLYRKSSFLLNQLGKQVFPAFIHIKEDPHLPLGLGSAPFDGNGVATRENIFVDQGILQSYALGTYSARKLGMQTTGNAGGTHNLTIASGDKDLAQLLKLMDKGLLVTELMGQGINLLTGDYSRGAAGFWVEKGEIQYPVQGITIAGTLQDIFGHIVHVGNDIDTRGNVRSGSILIEEMTIAGT